MSPSEQASTSAWARSSPGSKQVVIERLFTRFPDLSLGVPGSALEYTGRLGVRALTALPVRLM